jgi:hypothetical protein
VKTGTKSMSATVEIGFRMSFFGTYVVGNTFTYTSTYVKVDGVSASPVFTVVAASALVCDLLGVLWIQLRSRLISDILLAQDDWMICRTVFAKTYATVSSFTFQYFDTARLSLAEMNNNNNVDFLLSTVVDFASAGTMSPLVATFSTVVRTHSFFPVSLHHR